MPSNSSLRPLAALLAVAVLSAYLLWMWQAQLIAPTPSGNTGFSSAKAFETLSRLLAEQVPHPAGSPENAVVRDRIVAELTASGYKPEIQSVFQCSPSDRSAGCSAVENIVAVRKGTGTGKAILATAHYDSVPAGPGVGDDGAGVAVMLELAKHLAAKPPARNDVIILISDSEETGLRGALAFAEHHPLMKRVGLVVNVEARGTSGPSIMFETGSGNARLMDLFAGAVDRPVSNSLAYEIYRLLPNDTDFSIYKRYGLTGFNFAIIGSASLYHSRHDDLAHLDKNSLQHHGDNVFALMSKLTGIDLAKLKTGADASYFDLFGQTMVVWPADINLPAAIAALLAIVGLIVAHRDAFSLRAVAWSVLALVGIFASLFALGWALSYPLGIWPGVHPLDHPEPWPARIAIAAAATFVAILVATFIAGRSDSRASLLVNWLVLAILASACAAYLSGASYALVWPALIVAIVGWAETLLGKKSALTLTAGLGFAAIAFFWLAHMLALEAVIGFSLSQFKLLALGPFALALAPNFATAPGATRRAWPALLVCAAVVAIAAFFASRVQAFSPDHPRPLNIVYYDDKATNAPRWLISELPTDETFLKASGFSPQDEEYVQYGLFKTKGRFKAAIDQKLPPPVFAVAGITARDGLTVVAGTLQAVRGGFVMALGVAPGSGVRTVRIDGQEVLGQARLGGKEPVTARLFGLALRPIAFEIAFDPTKPAKIVLIERSPLPESDEARALTAARPADAMPVHGGDGASVFVSIDLAALKAGP
ncbi:MAG: M28 family peptidase [Alphaproteobacteria bacterium]|nr:M28 family peptidase [Alphaproteobacteria bacterium]